MDTRFLESFIHVVELGSMAEAARRLNLTPAAVAQRVKALEVELGMPLLARAGRIVRPTEAGHAVYHRSSSVLRSLRGLKAAAMLDVVGGGTPTRRGIDGDDRHPAKTACAGE